jgi:hypothetical protein
MPSVCCGLTAFNHVTHSLVTMYTDLLKKFNTRRCLITEILDDAARRQTNKNLSCEQLISFTLKYSQSEISCRWKPQIIWRTAFYCWQLSHCSSYVTDEKTLELEIDSRRRPRFRTLSNVQTGCGNQHSHLKGAGSSLKKDQWGVTPNTFFRVPKVNKE